MGVLRACAVGTAFVVASVGLAYHAAAEPPMGRYTATVIDEASGQLLPDRTTTLVFQGCGSGCTHVVSPIEEFELRQQETVWAGSALTAKGEACTHSLDARLVWTRACTGPAERAQLTKSG